MATIMALTPSPIMVVQQLDKPTNPDTQTEIQLPSPQSMTTKSLSRPGSADSGFIPTLPTIPESTNETAVQSLDLDTQELKESDASIPEGTQLGILAPGSDIQASLSPENKVNLSLFSAQEIEVTAIVALTFYPALQKLIEDGEDERLRALVSNYEAQHQDSDFAEEASPSPEDHTAYVEDVVTSHEGDSDMTEPETEIDNAVQARRGPRHLTREGEFARKLRGCQLTNGFVCFEINGDTKTKCFARGTRPIPSSRAPFVVRPSRPGRQATNRRLPLLLPIVS